MRQAAIVEATGALTLIEDSGRYGHAHLGVSRAGAFDQQAWSLANRLVGNPGDAPAFECLGGGLTLRFTRHVTVAVTGARGPLDIDGHSADGHSVLHLLPGQVLHLGPPTVGIRYYAALSGGVMAQPVLGSRSYDTLGRIGPAPLGTGDEVFVGEEHDHPTVEHAPAREAAEVFDVLPGPDARPGTLQALCSRHWDLDPHSNRIGVRLAGYPIDAPDTSLPSKPMVLGAVQLPPNGLPIILGPDHPTTGGYPVIAVVTRRSMDDVAQWAGGPRRFAPARPRR